MGEKSPSGNSNRDNLATTEMFHIDKSIERLCALETIPGRAPSPAVKILVPRTIVRGAASHRRHLLLLPCSRHPHATKTARPTTTQCESGHWLVEDDGKDGREKSPVTSIRGIAPPGPHDVEHRRNDGGKLQDGYEELLEAHHLPMALLILGNSHEIRPGSLLGQLQAFLSVGSATTTEPAVQDSAEQHQEQGNSTVYEKPLGKWLVARRLEAAVPDEDL
mmetsp:Transcript_29051/g.72968  ORF Transcript_29051/g.72968 Transcript_29051/m.72968 type:complete len:220 (+) Transcript_29051:129-788(+)